jgi:opacity protein-like surface antigen
MKKTLIGAAAVAALLSGTASAQTAQSYVQVHGGAFFPTADGLESTVGFFDEDVEVTGSIDYNTGWALGALYGYNVSPNFAVEGEFTYRSNDVDGFEFEALGDTTEEAVSGSLDTMAFMVNGVLKASGDKAMIPYVGAGVGYVTVDQDDVDLDGAFGYQVKAGVDFPVGQGAFGVEAAYLGTTDFEAEEEGVEIAYEYGGVSLLATYKFGF